jgi:hypothetical protein
MIAVSALAIVVLLALVLSRSSQSRLSAPERVYLLLAPLPCVVALLVPAIIGTAGASPSGPASWSNRFTFIGACLSGLLVAAGMFLALQRLRRGATLDLRLAAGLLMAAVPLLMVGLIGILYAVR